MVPFHTLVLSLSEFSQKELTHKFDQNEGDNFGLYLLETSTAFFARHPPESFVITILDKVVLHTRGSSNTSFFVSYCKDPAKYDYTGERAADDEVPWCFSLFGCTLSVNQEQLWRRMLITPLLGPRNYQRNQPPLSSLQDEQATWCPRHNESKSSWCHRRTPGVANSQGGREDSKVLKLG